MKRMYVNLDTELARDLARYLEREGNHHGKRAEVLRRALREFLERERLKFDRIHRNPKPSFGDIRILQR